MAEETKQSLAKQKKKWFEVFAPAEFRSAFIAEIPAFKAEELMGREIEINLSYLLEDPKKQNFKASFKIVEIYQNKAITSILSFKFVPTALKRMIRKGKDKIDDSFVCKTNDGKKLRVKPVMITKAHTKRNIKSKIIQIAREQITQKASTLTATEFFSEVINNRLPMLVKDGAKKVMPLSLAQIRQVILLDK